VVTTASPKNHDLVKSFGADAVFDYRDPDVVQKIKDWAGDKPVSGGLEQVVRHRTSLSYIAQLHQREGVNRALCRMSGSCRWFTRHSQCVASRSGGSAEREQFRPITIRSRTM
jgi:hypothetical protein